MMLESTASTIRQDVSASDKVIAAANPRRIALIISSEDSVDLYLNLGKVAVAGEGIFLKSGVAPFTMSLSHTGTACQQEVHCVASGAGVINVIEVTGGLG